MVVSYMYASAVLELIVYPRQRDALCRGFLFLFQKLAIANTSIRPISAIC